MAETNFKFCTTWGRKVALNAQFCAGCGADLGAPEEQHVQQDAVTGEAVVGWTSGVVIGNRWGTPNQMLLFTTDRTVVAKTSSVASGLRSQAERMAKGAQFGVVDEILSENEKNYAILHSEITQLRVKLPRVLRRIRVTLTTA
jgi:hypothetical protein